MITMCVDALPKACTHQNCVGTEV